MVCEVEATAWIVVENVAAATVVEQMALQHDLNQHYGSLLIYNTIILLVVGVANPAIPTPEHTTTACSGSMANMED